MHIMPRGAARIGAGLAAALVCFLLFSLAACGPRSLPFSDALIGSWQGTISIEGRTLSIVVRFEKSGKAVMDILSTDSGESVAGSMSFPLTNLAFRPPRVDFDLKAGSDLALFRGEITADRIEGSFEQAGHKGSFSLAKRSGGSAPAAVEAGINVVLKTSIGDLHGSLLVPDGSKSGGADGATQDGGAQAGPLPGGANGGPGGMPVVLLVAGAQGMDRDGDIPTLRMTNGGLRLYAEALAKRGIASVRYDQRGVGESAPAHEPGTPLLFSQLVDDAAAWLTSLKADPRYSQVAIAGYGDGALIAMAAAARVGVAALISINGPGLPADSLLRAQLASQPTTIRDQANRIIDQLKAGREVPAVPTSLQALFGRDEQPYLISKFQYDPRTEIAKLAMPVLIVQGTSDLQVSAQEAELLHQADPRSYLDLIRGMNHVMRTVSSDRDENLASYSNPDLPINPELIQVTSEFLRQALGLTLSTGPGH